MPYNMMIYSVGGGNLDDNMEEELEDLMLYRELDSTNVAIFVQMKYSSAEGIRQQKLRSKNKFGEKYVPGGKPATVYRYEMTDDLMPLEDKKDDINHYFELTAAERWGDAHAEMFQPDSVASFVRYCKREAPADNYVMVMYGHGSGWAVDAPEDQYHDVGMSHIGVLLDDNLKQRAMTARELRQGLERAGVHLKLLYLDCCMLNNIEFLSELTGVTDYVIASGHTNRGGSFSHFLKALESIAQGCDFKREMTAYLDSVALEHNDYLPPSKDTKVPMNKDFVLTDMKKLPAVWGAMRRFIDYLCKYEAGSDDDYVEASTKCYQYFNDEPMYDMLDYCRLLVEGPYRDSQELRGIYNELKRAVRAAQVYHAYALDHTELKVNYPLSYSITLGAQGKLQDNFKEGYSGDHLGYRCYNDEGHPVLWQASRNRFLAITDEAPNVQTEWKNTIYTTEFEKRTGWSRWLKLNPAMPLHNPPYNDNYDHYRK